MFGGLFGRSNRNPWDSVPDRLHDHLKSTLSPLVFSSLERVVARHRPQDAINFGRPSLHDDIQAQVYALSMSIMEVHGRLIRRGAEEFLGGEARLLVSVSLELNDRDWNPAWAWQFHTVATSLAPDEVPKHIERVLYAYEHATSHFEELLGRRPAVALVPYEIRGAPLFLALKYEMANRLTEDEFDVFLTSMEKEWDGEKAKHALVRLFSNDKRPKLDVLEFAVRIASQMVHIHGQGEAAQFNLKEFAKYERCAAAMNPRHLPSRLELVAFYVDLEEMEPGKGHIEQARDYAQQAMSLIDDANYDLGKPGDVGPPSPEVSAALIERRRALSALLSATTDG